MKSESVPPSVDLLESMRSIGYSLEAAVADLVDNSITAGAHNIQVDADVVEGKHFAILDDGRGMTAAVAREALRLAGSVRERGSTDLGRFGLGLKTASLSQARCLTVVSKQGDTVTALRWDIDFVRESGEWLLIVIDAQSLSDIPLWPQLAEQHSGTLVVWTDLDLLIGDSESPGEFISESLQGVSASLGLTFHRFISSRANGLAIRINGKYVEAMDPFLSKNPKTQPGNQEKVQIGDSTVTVEAFTLPHPSGLTAKERRRPDLGEDMRRYQGFYIYRNKRLISHGTWFGLARANELSKQTRIKVDVPPSLDDLWHLDIRKSRVEPPHSFKLRLRQLIGPILQRGHEVHAFRGRRTHSEVAYVWSKLKTRDGFGYEINFDNQLVESVLSRLNADDADRVADLLRTVANTFPVLDAYTEMAANVSSLRVPTDGEAMNAKLRMVRQSGLFASDPASAVSQLAHVEPFNTVDDLYSLVREVWEEDFDAE